uniref:long-chain-fatty-acid--CoA ligase n=1 Tax=Echeneis naucrates TaxID=173247 RepID=A0A665V9V3_ECHNA
MITLLFTSAVAGLLALTVYQTLADMHRGIITYLDCFLQQARTKPNKPFIIFEEQTLTYQDVERRSNQFANAFRTEGSLTKGDIVAQFMCNEPDFICVWFGLCKLGCEVAFLNVNIKTKSLLHCIRSCGARALLVGKELLKVVEEVLPDLMKDNVDVWVVDHTSPSEKVKSLLDKVEHMLGETLSERPKADIMSNFLFIFTSGTTGLSKAARVGHLKAIASMAFLPMCGATSDDIIYITLPLYHMSASLLGIGGCIHLGATCVLKKKFSASHFWKDCVKHNVTVVQYIGELCRYLLNHPLVPEERLHQVRLAAGSGLRSDIWKEFTNRFGGIKIREGYGLTEYCAITAVIVYMAFVGHVTNSQCLNVSFQLFMPFELLRYDPQTYKPIRTASGRCIRVQAGEAGILVAPLTAMNQFLGYAGDKVQSEKKLVRDVFKSGDVYFNTGDLLFLDDRGFLYFHDRIGDTFRWKGENVSTTEVAEVLGSLDFIKEANVYGVSVPGYEGRTGMAAIVLKHDSTLNGTKLFNHLVQTLPAYAWPRFIRIQTSLDVTETFKQQKVKLVQEGVNLSLIQDPLYFLDQSQKDYVFLTVSIHQGIMCGEISL